MSTDHLQAMLDEPESPQDDTRALAPVIHGKFQLTSTGLTVTNGPQVIDQETGEVLDDGKPTYQEWEEVGHILAVMERGIAFIVGDWIRFGEAQYGHQAAQVIDARSWSAETVRNYVWISKNVPAENRMLDRGLSVRHHQLVAGLPPAEQRRWLRRALNDGGEHWSTNQLRAALKEGDPVEATAWYVIVKCKSEAARDDITGRLRAEGYECKTNERYEVVKPETT